MCINVNDAKCAFNLKCWSYYGCCSQHVSTNGYLVTAALLLFYYYYEIVRAEQNVEK